MIHVFHVPTLIPSSSALPAGPACFLRTARAEFMALSESGEFVCAGDGPPLLGAPRHRAHMQTHTHNDARHTGTEKNNKKKTVGENKRVRHRNEP